MTRPSKRTFRFTAQAIKGLPLPDREQGQLDYFDATSGYQGFGIRISYGGRRTWFCMYRHKGLRRRYNLGTHPLMTLSVARDEATKILRAASLGHDPASEKRGDLKAPTFKELAAEYVERQARPHKRSWKRDQAAIDNYFNPRFGSRKAAEITRGQVKSFLDGIAKEKPVQANRLLEIIRRVYSWSIEADLVSSNPCAGIQRPGRERKSERWLPAGEVRAVWTATDTLAPKMRDYFRLMLLLGQRPGEVRTMHHDDIRLDESWWIIPGAEPAGFEGSARRTKNGLAHAVPLPPMALEAVRRRLTEVDEHGWLFPRRGGGAPMGATAVKKGCTRLIQAADRAIKAESGDDDATIAAFTPHALRATVATHLDMEPLAVRRQTISKLLNHADASITAQYARHGFDVEKRRALEAWERRLWQIVETSAVDNVVNISG